MNARALFVAADGRAHAPWRILIFLVLWALCAIVVLSLLSPVLKALTLFAGTRALADALGMTLSLGLAHAIMLYQFDRRDWSYPLLHSAAARPRVLAYGFLIGAAPIAVASLVLLAAGWLAIVPSPDGSWWAAAARVSAVLLLASCYEELLSRGYVFATLREWLGRTAAVALTSLAFGLLHLMNPGAEALPIVMVTLAGVFLASVVLVTRSLYAAWMAHFAWNWVMAVPLHVEVSGLPMAHPDYRTIDAGPDLITGGAWGPEGGLGAAFGMLGGLAYLYWRNSRTRHDEPKG